ncbi:hypothetical protein AB0J55_00420 [Amycolatopsis sp. NPDC049688]|uniref:hypothetical protein n=1 Tax=Amycolatopsis sp. NPDC049688 TaxID=3154733 RepID=UPI003448841B
MVESDRGEGSLRDGFRAAEDGIDGGVANEVRQAADHAAGAVVEQVSVAQEVTGRQAM